MGCELTSGRLGSASGLRRVHPRLDLGAERLEQSYARLPGEGGRQRCRYAAPALDFTWTLVYDEGGLVLDYPGIAVRAR